MSYPDTCAVLGCHRRRAVVGDGRSRHSRCEFHTRAALAGAFGLNPLLPAGPAPAAPAPVVPPAVEVRSGQPSADWAPGELVAAWGK